MGVLHLLSSLLHVEKENHVEVSQHVENHVFDIMSFSVYRTTLSSPVNVQMNNS